MSLVHQTKKPRWIRAPLPSGATYHKTKKIVSDLGLATVCQEAACPNIGECWKQAHATFMIMGEVCTRACAFCNVETGKPLALDASEPARLAEAVLALGLKHVVITSVDRDDLPDGGAAHFAKVIAAVRQQASDTTIEILTPDFRHKPQALEILAAEPPDIFNHNLETAPRLYATIRPGARYFTSLDLLQQMKRFLPKLFTKSGLMVGLGETKEEVHQVMDDMRAANVDFITIGQYLRPTPNHAPVARYVELEEFASYKVFAEAKGFLLAACNPMTRSSYHAGADFAKLKQQRYA